ncbi:MAG: hypothetical protein QXG86_03100, partial [Candidatus Woesearchaeota archaeon]
MNEEDKIKELVTRYKQELAKKLTQKEASTPITTREYQEFKKEFMPAHLTIYEKLCNLSEKILKLKPDAKTEPKIQEAINICHLNITPAGAVSFAYLAPIFFIFVGVFLSIAVPTITGGEVSLFFLMFFLLAGTVLIIPLNKLPDFLANNWRMRASNQMVLCIFYTVTYMRHTSNLERAINFASEHLTPPLSLDLKKVLWDVETEKYESIKESLDAYLETWKKWNMEFIEAFHLIESSLYEGVEKNRLETLDKALAVMLDETYERMLHYAQNLKSPLTMIHMMGIILPILGLVILPLVVSFMENVKWYHLAMLYNIILPTVVYYLVLNTLSKRPTGYGDTDISEENPELKKYKNVIIKFGKTELKINPLFISLFLGLFFFMVAISPIIIHIIIPDEKWDIAIVEDSRTRETRLSVVDSNTPKIEMQSIKFSLLGYRKAIKDPSKTIGPYGLGAAILSLAFTLSLGLSIGLYYKLKSKNIIKIREEAKRLEEEFSSALFQLGNRLGDGLPAEIAFGKVAAVMEGTTSGNFFKAVELNIRRLGMSVEQAIFDKRTGALLQYPSKTIDSSMKVLVESVKKGPIIASQALINVSRYIKEIHKVDERLKDLMADIISDIKSQINFLTPAISGIVIGITSMITTIIGSLAIQLEKIQETAGTANVGGAGQTLIGLFGDGIPTYFFQLIVGIYVVQIIYILTIMANGIENGADTVSQEYLIGQ